jgi:hypothetical protein
MDLGISISFIRQLMTFSYLHISEPGDRSGQRPIELVAKYEIFKQFFVSHGDTPVTGVS